MYAYIIHDTKYTIRYLSVSLDKDVFHEDREHHRDGDGEDDTDRSREFQSDQNSDDERNWIQSRRMLHDLRCDDMRLSLMRDEIKYECRETERRRIEQSDENGRNRSEYRSDIWEDLHQPAEEGYGESIRNTQKGESDIVYREGDEHQDRLTEQPLARLALHARRDRECVSVIFLRCKQKKEFLDTLLLKREVEREEEISDEMDESLEHPDRRGEYLREPLIDVSFDGPEEFILAELEADTLRIYFYPAHECIEATGIFRPIREELFRFGEKEWEKHCEQEHSRAQEEHIHDDHRHRPGYAETPKLGNRRNQGRGRQNREQYYRHDITNEVQEIHPRDDDRRADEELCSRFHSLAC